MKTLKLTNKSTSRKPTGKTLYLKRIVDEPKKIYYKKGYAFNNKFNG